MPDIDRRLRVVADLDVEVGDDRGATTARLRSADGLVLDVADPAVLLRCVPGGGLSRARSFALPPWVPLEQVANVPVLLTSRGRDIGRLVLSPSGRVTFTPTLAGIPTIVRTAASYGSSSGSRPVRARNLLSAAGLAALVAIAVRALRRR